MGRQSWSEELNWPIAGGQLQEQAIACTSCGAAELIRQDSERLPSGKWPAWEPGLQPFECPACGDVAVWATEPREAVPHA